MLLSALDAVEGVQELQDARAAALGIGLAISGSKDSKVRQATRALIKRAYPEVHD